MRYRGWVLVPALLLSLTGCRGLLPRERDITTVELMQVLALDEGEGGRIRVTAASGVRDGGQGGEPKPPVVLRREENTVLAACAAMQSGADGYASFSHVEEVLLGEQAAEQSVEGLLDFVERDPEMRLDTHLYIVEGKGAELVEVFQKEERSAAELLEGIGRELEGKAGAWPVSVREALIDLEENGCALLPVLEVEKQEDKPELRCERMGVLQGDRYRKSLTPEQSRGAALLLGRLGTGEEELELRDGTSAGLRLTRSSCRWTPRWQGERLAGLTAQVEVKADLAELPGEPSSHWERETLEQALNTRLEGELRSVLKESQSSGGDFLHLQRCLRVRSPARYRSIDEHWEAWFPALELGVQVRCTVERSHDLKE